MYDGGTILALDAATRTGVCEGEPGAEPVLETVNFSRPNSPDLFGAAIVWITRRINTAAAAKRPIRLIVIEGLVPQYNKTIQCGIWANLAGVAAIKGIPVMEAPISSWRAFVLGSGKLNKVSAKARAINITTQLGWNPADDNAAEAGCIWLWACAQLAPKQAHRFEPLFLRRSAWPAAETHHRVSVSATTEKGEASTWTLREKRVNPTLYGNSPTRVFLNKAKASRIAALRLEIIANFEALDRITEDLAQLGPDAPAHLYDALLRRLDDARANATRVRELFGPSLDEGVIPLGLYRGDA